MTTGTGTDEILLLARPSLDECTVCILLLSLPLSLNRLLSGLGSQQLGASEIGLYYDLNKALLPEAFQPFHQVNSSREQQQYTTAATSSSGSSLECQQAAGRSSSSSRMQQQQQFQGTLCAEHGHSAVSTPRQVIHRHCTTPPTLTRHTQADSLCASACCSNANSLCFC